MKRAGRRIPARHRSRRALPRRPGAKGKYQKAQAKAEHAGEKLGKAREKLDKTEAKRAAKKPRGLQKRQSGEPAQKRGSMSTTRYTRLSMKMWVWKEPINPSWPQRPEPGN